MLDVRDSVNGDDDPDPHEVNVPEALVEQWFPTVDHALPPVLVRQSISTVEKDGCEEEDNNAAQRNCTDVPEVE